MEYEVIDLEEALKLLIQGKYVYYPSVYGIVLMQQIDPEYCPKESSWSEIASLLYYKPLYKRVYKED